MPKSFLAPWELPNGDVVLIEAEHVFCCSCGKLYGLVPKENTVETVVICRKCFETYGAELIAGYYVQKTDEFCKDVEQEMHDRYGRTLTDEELYNEDRDHNLGPALEALIRDSPFPSKDNRPKR
jgi:hypothetical protein